MARSVLALTRYGRLGASSRVRVLQYIPYLERRGLNVRVHALFSDTDLRRLYKDGRRSFPRLMAALAGRIGAAIGAHRGGVVWLQQELFPFLPYALEAALLAGKKLVIDFDDAQHLYYKGRFFGANKIEKLMRRADAVTVGSPMMAEVAREAGARNVQLVFSAVDTAAFPPSAPVSAPFTVGWIGTPMTANQSLHILREPLARFLKETGSKAIFIGMDETQVPDLPGERIAWSEAAERTVLPRLSVGICPLEDSPWTRGKSGYKIIQYMAAGKPALTSPVGIAADIVEDGLTGFHCRNADDWYRRLRQLHDGPAMLAALGTESRRRAEAKYDISIAAAAIHGILEECLRG
ncbi:MAG: glycosyltransferase family 4 protein [Rhodospirillaceae bacterium]|nr:glycosyltransferase family 4 protein [Rhodospirillaceae bacterium]